MGLGAIPLLAGGALSGIGSLIGGGKQANAATQAARIQANAAQQALNVQQQQFQQTQTNLAPYRDVGQTGINLLGSTLPYTMQPIQTGVPQFQPTIQQLEQTPGYQFTLNQGLKAAQNSYAAGGLPRSGAAMEGATNYATGLAGTTLGQNAGIFFQNQSMQLQGRAMDIAQRNQIFNQNLALTNVGANAAAMTGQFGQQAASNVGNLLTGAGAATAAGVTGAAGALAGGTQGAFGGVGNALTLAALFNPNLFGGGGGTGGINPTTLPVDAFAPASYVGPGFPAGTTPSTFNA